MKGSGQMIGLVTIGQSPRNDVVRSMFEISPPVLIQAGALDGLSSGHIEALQPTGEEPVLVSVLRNGSEVSLSKRLLVPHLQNAILSVERQGAQIICVLCTGTFDVLHSNSRLVFPDQLLSGVIDVLLPRGPLGLLIPDMRQEDQMRLKWERSGRAVLIASASPYSDDHRIEYGVQQLEEDGAELLLMDCMGYTRDMQKTAQEKVAIPVVLSSGLVGSILSEFTGAYPLV